MIGAPAWVRNGSTETDIAVVEQADVWEGMVQIIHTIEMQIREWTERQGRIELSIR